MGSGAVIYIPGFINIVSGIQKLMEWGYTYRQQGDLISHNYLFFKIGIVSSNSERESMEKRPSSGPCSC
jgi:hypothetical protein